MFKLSSFIFECRKCLYLFWCPDF